MNYNRDMINHSEVLPYSFKADKRIYDNSFKQRLDHLVKNQHQIVVLGIPHQGFLDFISYQPTIFTVPDPTTINHVDDFRISYDSCVIWQYGPEKLLKSDSQDLISKLKKRFRAGVIETHNYLIGVYQSSWTTQDFLDMGLNWRRYGLDRGKVDQLIGYWDT